MEDDRTVFVQWWTRVSTAVEEEGDLLDPPSTLVGDPGDRNRPVRERFLAAAAAVLLEDGRQNLNEMLTVQRLASRAGASRQSWHNQFRDTDFLGELADWAADLPTVRDQTRFLSQWVDLFLKSEGSRTLTGVPDLLRMSFELLAADEKYRLQLLLALIAADVGPVSSPLRGRYDVLRIEMPDIYRRLVQHVGHEPVPPHTYESMATALIALSDGFVARRQIDPEYATGEAFANAAIALISGAVLPDHRARSSPVPPPSIFATENETEGPAGPEVVASTADVMKALEQACNDASSSLISLEDVARRSSSTVHALRLRYGSIDGLMHEAWERFVIDDVRLAARSPGTPLDRIWGALAAAASRGLEHRWLSSARVRERHDEVERRRVSATVPASRDDKSGGLPAILVALLHEARAAKKRGERGGIGELADDELARLAQRLEIGLLFEVLDRGARTGGVTSGAAASEIVVSVWETTLNGLRSSRRPRRSA